VNFYSRQPVEPAFVEIVLITADHNFGEPQPIRLMDAKSIHRAMQYRHYEIARPKSTLAKI